MSGNVARAHECPADRQPWRDTPDGPMPMLVPAAIMDGFRKKYPKIWIEELPAGIPLLGRALTLADLR